MWTEELQQQTREFFKKMPIAAMKHFGDSKFGFCTLKDGKYTIMDRSGDSNEKWEYDSMEEMLKNGWAID